MESQHEAGSPLVPEIVLGEPAPLDEKRLLAFYDRLRERVVVAAGRRMPRLTQGRMDVLLLAPDLFMLLVRLVLDPKVPGGSRRLFAGSLAYFLLPVDFLPEAVLGVGGYIDDVVLVTAVLAHALGPELEPLAQRYWSGSARLRTVLADVTRSAHGVLGKGVLGRLRGWLARKGVALDGPAA
jgi:uncharacterized membrane protein YkvA (DUF1232 family)